MEIENLLRVDYDHDWFLYENMRAIPKLILRNVRLVYIMGGYIAWNVKAADFLVVSIATIFEGRGAFSRLDMRWISRT